MKTRSGSMLLMVIAAAVLLSFAGSPASAQCDNGPCSGQKCNGVNCTICGGNGVDNLCGTSNADVICAFDGSDTITGGGLGDTICAGLGADDIDGQSGTDLIISECGADEVVGGSGIDTAKYTTAVIASLAAGTADDEGACGIDTLFSIENLTGSGSADTLIGQDGINNTLAGMVGPDILNGGDGPDTLDGGNGTDTADYTGNATGVTVFLSTGENSDGDDLISIENLTGTAFNDTLGGNTGNNNLKGGAGNDDLLAGSGTGDVCDGGPGDDVCVGCETRISCENERPDRCEVIGCPPIP